jgi:hypothetical protein
VSLVRIVFEGSCGEPQPSNWQDACQRLPGHYGAHRVRLRHGWDLAWRSDRQRVVMRPRLGPRNYVKAARKP